MTDAPWLARAKATFHNDVHDGWPYVLGFIGVLGPLLILLIQVAPPFGHLVPVAIVQTAAASLVLSFVGFASVGVALASARDGDVPQDTPELVGDMLGHALLIALTLGGGALLVSVPYAGMFSVEGWLETPRIVLAVCVAALGILIWSALAQVVLAFARDMRGRIVGMVFLLGAILLLGNLSSFAYRLALESEAGNPANVFGFALLLLDPESGPLGLVNTWLAGGTGNLGFLDAAYSRYHTPGAYALATLAWLTIPLLLATWGIRRRAPPAEPPASEVPS